MRRNEMGWARVGSRVGRRSEEGGGDKGRVYRGGFVGLTITLVVVKRWIVKVEVDGIASGSIQKMLVG